MNEASFENVLENNYKSFSRSIRQFQHKLLSLRKSWEEYVKTGSVRTNKYLTREILDSWERSRNNGIDPFGYEPIVVSKKELEERLKKNKTLCEICQVCVNAYMESLKDTGFRVDLLDTELILIKQFGDEKNIRKANEQGTFPGVTREEALMGTSSGSLAAILNKPVQTAGPEHYKLPLQDWTCSSTPIRQKDGKLLGILTLSGDFFQVHEHTLGMSIAITKAIEYCYYQNQEKEEIELANKYIDGIINTISDGIIAVDTEGKIRLMNKTAGQILNMDPAGTVNNYVADCFDEQSSIMKTLNGRSCYSESELLFLKKGKRSLVVGSIMPVGDKKEKSGALAIFKGLKSARGFMKNLAGFHAFFTFDDIIGNTQNMQMAKSLARQAAKLPFNVLLQGESGTGKEMFAQALHNESDNSLGPFVSINCGAIPADLIESELFGYEAGSFTGALKGGKPGKFQLAEDGTIFLDEINAMPLNLQVKLLRVLQNRIFMRVGGIDEVSFNAKIVSASNTDLLAEVRKGNFREDLFFRLNVIDIRLPPLREQKEDIPILAAKFLDKTCEHLGVKIALNPAAMDVLLSYSWPGNIRELQNLIEKAVVIALSKGNKTIERKDLIQYTGYYERLHENFSSCNSQASSLAGNERILIETILKNTKGNKSKAAEILGITRKTLYKKIHDMNIQIC